MDVSNKLFGFYRAKVLGNKDPEFRGRVIVWIPQIMPEIDPDRGLLARPANNPVGGRNDEGDKEHHFMGTSYIPKKGSWVFVFFESGNPSNPYYFGACDLENTTVLPECQQGKNPEDKWVIFKSHEGRTIVISDDPDDERVEITGKKRKMIETNQAPTGDFVSVFKITDNQTTMLLDEREEKQKILIKSHKGDYIKFDTEDRTIEIQVASDIHIKSGGHLYVTTTGDQHYMAGENMYFSAGKDIQILAGGSIISEANEEYNFKSGSNSIEKIGGQKIVEVNNEIFIKSKNNIHTQSGKMIARDAVTIEDNSASSEPPPKTIVDATPAIFATPDGDRES